MASDCSVRVPFRRTITLVARPVDMLHLKGFIDVLATAFHTFFYAVLSTIDCCARRLSGPGTLCLSAELDSSSQQRCNEKTLPPRLHDLRCRSSKENRPQVGRRWIESGGIRKGRSDARVGGQENAPQKGKPRRSTPMGARLLSQRRIAGTPKAEFIAGIDRSHRCPVAQCRTRLAPADETASAGAVNGRGEPVRKKTT